jgi:hypothetical protein
MKIKDMRIKDKNFWDIVANYYDVIINKDKKLFP